MKFVHYFRGRLIPGPASLMLLSNELLKWQFPTIAVAEKLRSLVAFLRANVLQLTSALARR